MIYICDACRFLFERTEEPERCDDCCKETIREANESEQQEFEEIKREHKR